MCFSRRLPGPDSNQRSDGRDGDWLPASAPARRPRYDRRHGRAQKHRNQEPRRARSRSRHQSSICFERIPLRDGDEIPGNYFGTRRGGRPRSLAPGGRRVAGHGRRRRPHRKCLCRFALSPPAPAPRLIGAVSRRHRLGDPLPERPSGSRCAHSGSQRGRLGDFGDLFAELYEGVFYSRDPRKSESALQDFLPGTELLGIDHEIVRLSGRQRGRLRAGARLLVTSTF